MPNPSGQNSPVNFDGFVQNIPYGDKARQGDLARSAPQAGGPAAASPINAPRRAQKQATRPQRGNQPQAQPVAVPVLPAPLPPQALLAQRAMQIAQIPGASPLVGQLAAEAANGS